MIEKDCPTCLYRRKNWGESEPCFTCTHPIDSMRKFRWKLDPVFKEKTYECNNNTTSDLLYSFVLKSNISFENRKHVEQMIDSGVLQICSSHFISAKIINKRTGEVTDLLK